MWDPKLFIHCLPFDLVQGKACLLAALHWTSLNNTSGCKQTHLYVYGYHLRNNNVAVLNFRTRFLHSTISVKLKQTIIWLSFIRYLATFVYWHGMMIWYGRVFFFFFNSAEEDLNFSHCSCHCPLMNVFSLSKIASINIRFFPCLVQLQLSLRFSWSSLAEKLLVGEAGHVQDSWL